jgi:integrase
MARRRGNSEGCIYQRKDGKWRVQLRLQGQRLSFSGKSRRECQEWLKKTIGLIDNGLNYVSTTITVSEYMNNWLAIAKTSRRASTWSHYEQLNRTYVLRYLGKIKLKDLRPDTIQLFYDRLLKEKVGEYTINKIHTMLHGALEQAVKIGLASRNAADAAIPPRPQSKEMQFLDDNQVSQMLLAARGSRMEAILHLAVATGMRQMELLGLKWTDLDWVKQTLRIERQLERSDSENIRFSPPKTKRGKRTISLGDQTIEVLQRWNEIQNEQRKAAGENWKETGLMFTTNVGTPICFRNLLRDFKLILQKAGLPNIRFHDLRHTAASLMLNHDIPVIVVSRRLGHAKPSITLDVYGHLIPSMQTEVAQKIDDLITPVAISMAPNGTEMAPEIHQKEQ